MEPSIDGFYTLKSGDGFALFDQRGFFDVSGKTPAGVFWRNMRHISGFEIDFGGAAGSIELAKATTAPGQLTFIYKLGTDATITRNVVMANGRVHEAISFHGSPFTATDGTLDFRLAADFADIFDARSGQRKKRGTIVGSADEKTMSWHYQWQNGQDENAASFRLSAPSVMNRDADTVSIHLRPQGKNPATIFISYGPGSESGKAPGAETFEEARRLAAAEISKLEHSGPALASSNPVLDRALRQSTEDLSMLCTVLDTGLYPYAGIPWFATPFGRDATITALLTLEDYPQIARGVLALQASRQATHYDKFTQAEPGRIFHEIRPGSESGAMRENPFAGYYGGADTTVLFPLLAREYCERTSDHGFLNGIWPNIQRALTWITDNMDRHGGYVRYAYDPGGLTHQGWKDSSDAVFHADAPDRLPPDPIALCEIQAYAYGALKAGGFFYGLHGEPEAGADYDRRARDLYERFNRDFWVEELGTYALALDGNNRPCKLQTSNAGHVFLTDLVPTDRAHSLANTILGEKSFSGFGIRTLAEGPGHDPLSYHRGSVWPHDTAVIAMGMAKYGLKDEVGKILEGLIYATEDNPRLPELFSGATKIPGKPKAPYPSACAPQAWAAAAPFGILSAWEKASGQTHRRHDVILLPNGLGELRRKDTNAVNPIF